MSRVNGQVEVDRGRILWSLQRTCGSKEDLVHRKLEFEQIRVGRRLLTIK